MMDQSRSVNNRNGDHAKFPTQHVRVLAPEGDGVRNTLANTPTAPPQYSYAAAKYRQKPGVKVTYDAFHYIEFVPGLELQLTNPDQSRSYVGIYLHENRLYILDATAPNNEAPPIIFQQSFGFLDAAGNPVRYRPFYVNRLPEPQGGQKP